MRLITWGNKLILHVDIFRLTHIQDEEIVTSFVLLKLCTISSWPHFCHTHPLLPDDDHNVDQYQGLPGRESINSLMMIMYDVDDDDDYGDDDDDDDDNDHNVDHYQGGQDGN